MPHGVDRRQLRLRFEMKKAHVVGDALHEPAGIRARIGLNGLRQLMDDKAILHAACRKWLDPGVRNVVSDNASLACVS
ncbi:MAG: hypothetical protein C0483_22480 [Pirellula sp.]|nr:hypothetical protein [Pirellula sp.]